MLNHTMTDKLDVDDLTQQPEESRTHTLDVKLTAAQIAVLQEKADKLGVTLEDYVLGVALAAAAVQNAGGSSSSSGAA